jgi:hypothetical protein
MFVTKFRLNLASNFDIKNKEGQTPTCSTVFVDFINLLEELKKIFLLYKNITHKNVNGVHVLLPLLNS